MGEMRLALEALYMPDGSTPEDASRRREIERAMRNSPVADEYVRKIRGAVARRDLGAPEVFAEESFPDANIVSEYIDLQLEKNIEREFEAACVETPEFLAELAVCFNLLNAEPEAGKPTRAPKNCRSRLYYVAWEETDERSKEKNVELEPALGATLAPTSGANDSANEKNKRNFAENRRKGVDKKGNIQKVDDKRTSRAASESVVQQAIRSERKIGRRARKLGVKGAIGLGTLGLLCCCWRFCRDDENASSLTLPPAAPSVAKLDSPNIDVLVDEPNNKEGEIVATESKKAPPAVLRINVAEASRVSPEEFARRREGFEVGGDVAREASQADDATYVALADETTNSESNQFKLKNPNLTRRGTIVIPEKNNDVFSTTRALY